MKKTAPPHVINVFRDRLVMCTPLAPAPLTFKFTPSMISDLEVTGHQELNTGLKGFMDQYKLKPTNLVIILHSSVYFEKDYPGPDSPPGQKLEEFIDTIPFSATSSKLFRSGVGYKQIVINRDLYESLKRSFENLGYTVTAVVPGFVLGTDPQTEFTADTCRVIYKKMDQITAESFSGFSDPAASFQQKEQIFLKRYQLPVVVISILALVTAVVVIPMTLKRPPAPVKKPTVPVSRPSPTSVPEPEILLATPSAELLRTYSVRILNGSGLTGQAALLSGKLREVGFANIGTGNTAETEKTLVIFSPPAASSAGEFVMDIVRNLYSDPSSETDTKAEIDVTIVIGKNTP